MFQVTFFAQHGLNLVHPPEMQVSIDMLFEKELLFVWDGLQDPHVVKEVLGRAVPFAFASIENHSRQINHEWKEKKFSLISSEDHTLSGLVLVGMSEEDFVILDQHHQTPIHRRRSKIKCSIGDLERVVHIYYQQGALLEE